MPTQPGIEVRQLGDSDVELFRELLGVFGRAFEMVDTYTAAQPSASYLRALLGSGSFIAVAALVDGAVVGGLAAYELRKFEQERSEIYIYDLAVDEAHRRQGIATAVINELRRIAATRGAYLIFVQADHGDDPPIALYTKLGVGENILHFNIAPLKTPEA